MLARELSDTLPKRRPCCSWWLFLLLWGPGVGVCIIDTSPLPVGSCTFYLVVCVVSGESFISGRWLLQSSADKLLHGGPMRRVQVKCIMHGSSGKRVGLLLVFVFFFFFSSLWFFFKEGTSPSVFLGRRFKLSWKSLGIMQDPWCCSCLTSVLAFFVCVCRTSQFYTCRISAWDC